MIGKPLMMMPLASAAFRASITGGPLLFGPSPEISMTRRIPGYGFSSNKGMARKLKTYVTSVGFFDLAIAAASMKAALEAWGSNTNLFHQGFAREVNDESVVEATMAKPGVVLRRPVGSNKPFEEDASLPTSLAGDPARTSKRRERSPREIDQKVARNEQDKLAAK